MVITSEAIQPMRTAGSESIAYLRAVLLLDGFCFGGSIMAFKREAYLDGPNLSLVNVLLFIEKRIRDGEKTFSYTLENGAIYTLIIRNPSGSNHSLTVDVTYTIEPKDKEKPLQVYNFRGMLFSGLQLFADRVLITGTCDNESDFIKRRFDDVWEETLKAFGTESTKHSENIIADNQGGTVTYKRNEQGQTIITGGTVNPGYYAELGQGAAIKPESQIRLNHTTGPFQPGLFPPQTKDEILRVTSETLLGLSGNADTTTTQSNAAKPEKPAIPKQGSSVDVWLDYYHAMKKAGYKMTFPMLQKESGYSANTFKQAHGVYKRNKGIDIPND